MGSHWRNAQQIISAVNYSTVRWRNFTVLRIWGTELLAIASYYYRQGIKHNEGSLKGPGSTFYIIFWVYEREIMCTCTYNGDDSFNLFFFNLFPENALLPQLEEERRHNMETKTNGYFHVTDMRAPSSQPDTILKFGDYSQVIAFRCSFMWAYSTLIQFTSGLSEDAEDTDLTIHS